MRFEDFKFIVLCDGLFQEGFENESDASQYLKMMKERYPNYEFTIYNVSTGSERELDRIWISYNQINEEYEYDF